MQILTASQQQCTTIVTICLLAVKNLSAWSSWHTVPIHNYSWPDVLHDIEVWTSCMGSAHFVAGLIIVFTLLIYILRWVDGDRYHGKLSDSQVAMGSGKSKQCVKNPWVLQYLIRHFMNNNIIECVFVGVHATTSRSHVLVIIFNSSHDTRLKR